MRKFIQNKLKEQKGLTLIELLAVIVILAIIAAIAIPAIGNVIQNSRNGAVKSDYQNALAAANVYFTENNSPNGTIVYVGTLAGKAMTTPAIAAPSTSYLEDQGKLLDNVVIEKVQGGNRISGSADLDGDGTNPEYTIATTFKGLTNTQISKISNSSFIGTKTATQ
ncbi:prepilin-type N-terminal cleavage/methylation domain-containing protein [Paenisporosarcina sp. NPDC076898]|uniref:prepilin-type N-terminal cleavage/methylation domain-containing protein n=1 Tax=unclassified Paenisporosarcina TaxID=2642018 RepID=UPI003D065D18